MLLSPSLRAFRLSAVVAMPTRILSPHGSRLVRAPAKVASTANCAQIALALVNAPSALIDAGGGATLVQLQYALPLAASTAVGTEEAAMDTQARVSASSALRRRMARKAKPRSSPAHRGNGGVCVSAAKHTACVTSRVLRALALALVVR